MHAPDNVIRVIFNSWVKFKFAQSLRPKYKQFFVYLLKNFSSLEGEELYADLLEHFTEDPSALSLQYYSRMGVDDPRIKRVFEYFEYEDPEWILPLDVFPRIDFEKSKMHMSFLPYEFKEDLAKEVHQKVFNYVMSLGIKSLMIPRADTLQKYGGQRYNDGGIVRFDYERPTNSFDSMFLYQRFLTKPLTPREVWLPGKAIKQNNAFMMLVHRQILSRDPVYPPSDIELMFEKMSNIVQDMTLMFDISGYGLQYLREILIAAQNAIRELYPCSEMEEQSEIMEEIFKKVSVQMPDGSVVYPPRGIGLGYYEDLKTIAMLAILQPFNPLSVYGDQGILPLTSLDFVIELLRFQFIMNPEKTVAGSSHGQIKWAGIGFTPTTYFKPCHMFSMVYGAFFSRLHWERKMGLHGISISEPVKYKSIQKRLADVYQRLYGYEFYPDDIYSSFDRGGIMIKSYETGYQKLWWLRGKMSPRSNLLYDATYQTPYKLVNKHKVSLRDAKAFSKKRKDLYRKNPVLDSILYDYANPRLVYNKKSHHIPRVLPRWADMNLILYHGISSGSLTCGLSDEEVKLAVERQSLSSDPFRARATGGYSIETMWRTSRPASQEWIDIADVMSTTSKIDALRVNRADLPQNLQLSEDPMYKETDLFSFLVSRASKRKRSQLSDDTLPLAKKITEEVREILPSLIQSGQVNHLADIVTAVDKRLQASDYGDNISESSHGLYELDEDYFADDIDMIDP